MIFFKEVGVYSPMGVLTLPRKSGPRGRFQTVRVTQQPLSKIENILSS